MVFRIQNTYAGRYFIVDSCIFLADNCANQLKLNNKKRLDSKIF